MPLERCPACDGAGGPPLLAWRDMPVHCNRLHDDAACARSAPRGDIELLACHDCGALYNRCFDPARVNYAAGYDNPLDHSPRFAAWQARQARELVRRYGLADGSLVEAGCGRGGFLAAARDAGARYCLGFEPAWAPDWPVPRGVRIEACGFDAAALGYAPSLLLTRHVVEHLHRPRALLAAMRHAGSPLVVEVPCAERIVDGAVWDIIYEHCVNYTAPALSALLEACGFCVEDVSTAFDGQFLVASARPGDPGRSSAPSPGRAAQHGEPSLTHRVASLIDDTAARLSTGRWAVWGAGSKGVTLLNLLPGDVQVRAVIDINPDKQSRHVPGTGQRIDAPSRVREADVDGVLVMNPAYAGEITAMLAGIGWSGEVVCVADRLPGAPRQQAGAFHG